MRSHRKQHDRSSDIKGGKKKNAGAERQIGADCRKRAVVYVRTAVMNRHAAAAQRALVALARKLGWPAHRIQIIDTDSGRSGLSDRRPGFRELMQRIERGEVGLVVVRDLARLSRDPRQLHEFLMTARRAGVRIVQSVEGNCAKDWRRNATELVPRIFKLFHRGMSPREIAARLRQLRVGSSAGAPRNSATRAAGRKRL